MMHPWQLWMADCTSVRSRYDDAMSDGYRQLLDAAIQHLEGLKSRGVRHVAVAPETLRALAQPPPKPVSNLKPAGPATPAAGPARPLIENPAASAPATPLVNPPPTFPIPPKKFPAPAAAPKMQAPAPRPEIISASPEKAAAFTALREKVLACMKCPHLASSRTTVVFGVGSVDAQLMFVGEAPGADEDEQGEPFVGRAGQLLTKIIQATGLERKEVYIANILKCRPDTPGQSAGNRPPTPEERATCIPYLQEQIDLIKPGAIVALGATAVDGLLGKTLGITRLRGNWQTYRGIPLMPTYHPAYLLRNQAMSEKRKVWEDILKVMEILGMPISEKQRNFFLKA
ncbi:MAG: uracil-DNA glycosylase family protein [Verrucomicrobiota bacterium]